jgi:dipeptidyl aminopeptidase/acylaminoacyl peptidase
VKSWLLAAAATAAFSVSAHAQATHSLADDAAAFGARESVSQPVLSPDGDEILYLTPGPGRSTVALVANLSTGATRAVTKSSGAPDQLEWCKYVSVKRAVCRVSALNDAGTGIIGSARLLALDLDGRNAKLLGQSSSAYDAYARQYDGDIVDWMDGRSGSVLMSRQYIPEEYKMNTRLVRDKAGLGVDRIDTASLRTSSIESANAKASGFMADGRGNVRLMSSAATTATGYLSGEMAFYYRTPASKDWHQVAVSLDDDWEPLAIDASSNQLYVLKKYNGRMALYAITLGDSPTEQMIAQNPNVDIDDVVRAGRAQRVIGYTFAEDTRRAIYFDPEFRKLSASLSKAIPNLPIVDFVDSSTDGNKLLIFAGSDKDPGRYYVFDRATKSLNEALLARPKLDGRSLATQQSVLIPAPDGVSIPAYLTLPPNSSGKDLPAVVLPHGGPSARDEWGFDWLPQFLAARGYAVIQPQYRGSAGFGDAWLNENGFKNWRTSIGDVTASAKWLVSQGIADPQRTAIVGWSYGGYAALQSAAIEPSLYKAVVAIAPVTDLAMLKEEFRNFTNYKLVAREIGSGPHVADGSPLRHAAEINAPVLLVHGTLDANVSYRQSQKMDEALKSAGKRSELITFDGLDHQLNDSAARIQMLTRIGEFLDSAIGH